jgi:hypothetical protein
MLFLTVFYLLKKLVIRSGLLETYLTYKRFLNRINTLFEPQTGKNDTNADDQDIENATNQTKSLIQQIIS